MNKTMISLLAMALISPFALAEHSSKGECDGGDNVYLGIIEVGTGDPEATFYIDDRNFVLGGGLWMYQESNLVYTAGGPADHNLQRGGVGVFLPGEGSEEICTDEGPWVPDTIIF